MHEVLAARVGELVDMGWTPVAHTETTATLETREPFNWLLFAFFILFLFGLGALLYLAFWLVTSRARLFLSVADSRVVESGDLSLVHRQELDREMAIRKAREIKQRGFLRVMWPSILAVDRGRRDLVHDDLGAAQGIV